MSQFPVAALRGDHTLIDLMMCLLPFSSGDQKFGISLMGPKSRRRAALLLDALGEAASFPVAATFLGCDHITLTCPSVVTLPSLTLTLDSLL